MPETETRTKPFAMCYCGEPLISTFAFSKKEFYCICCGSSYGFLEPRAAMPTPERQARHDELLAEWKEHAAGKLLSGGVMLQDCEKCRIAYEPHWSHATDEEKKAHEEALNWLRERAKGRELKGEG